MYSCIASRRPRIPTAGTVNDQTARVDVLTHPGALNRPGQRQLVSEITRIVADHMDDPSLTDPTWVLLREAADGGRVCRIRFRRGRAHGAAGSFGPVATWRADAPDICGRFLDAVSTRASSTGFDLVFREQTADSVGMTRPPIRRSDPTTQGSSSSANAHSTHPCHCGTHDCHARIRRFVFAPNTRSERPPRPGQSAKLLAKPGGCCGAAMSDRSSSLSAGRMSNERSGLSGRTVARFRAARPSARDVAFPRACPTVRVQALLREMRGNGCGNADQKPLDLRV